MKAFEMEEGVAGPSRATTSAEDEEEVVSIRQTELYKLLKPLMVYLEISALLHVRESKEHLSHRLRRVSAKDSGWQKIALRCLHVLRFCWDVFPVAVSACTLSSMIIFIVEFVKAEQKIEFAALSMELVAFMVMLQNLISLVIMYGHCESRMLLRLFQAYSSLFKDNGRQKKRLDDVVVWIGKLALVGCILINFLVILTWQLIIYYATTQQIDMGCLGATLIYVIKRTPILYYIAAWGALFIFPPITLMAALLCINCVILWKSYEVLNEQIEAAVESEDDFTVWPWFARHRQITQTLDSVNDIFGLYYLTFVMINTAVASLLAYTLVFTCHPNIMVMTIQITWGLVAMLFLFFSMFPPILVHNRAIKAWEDLCAIRMNHMRTRHGVHLAVLLARLSSKPLIGLSACGFFVVTQKFFIEVMSSIISYSIVLFNFSPPKDMCEMRNVTCGMANQ